MLEHALKYATLGIKVFPIREGLKTPATPNGFLAATDDAPIINQWWVQNPKYNLAIRTGRESGIFCLDIDCKNGKNGFEWLKAQGDLPPTIIQTTPSGGKHFIFKTPDFLVTSNSGKLAEGIDIRGEQGYILAPPSYLKETATYKFPGLYEWVSDQGIGDMEIPHAPQWLIDKLIDIIPPYEQKKEAKDDIDISIEDVMKFYNIQLKEVKAGVFQGAHPIHGSDNGSNFKIDTHKNVWSCYRHTKANGSPVGGGAVQLIAMMERIVSCEECCKGAVRGDKFKKVVSVLEYKFGTNIGKEKSDTVHPMYAIAENVKDGELGKDYVYCIEDNKYYCYDDNYWKNVHDLEIESDLNAHIPTMKKHTPSMKQQVFHHMRVLLQKRMDCFNSTTFINFPEGEFDPETKLLHPHNKEHYSTVRLPYSYNEHAECPLWIKTLGEILEGNQEKIDTLQEFFGYCLTSRMQLKKALLMLGESDTGKSTVLFVFKEMIGKINYSTVPLKNMGHPQYTPMMINKLVNLDTDVDKNAEAYEDNFKKITSYEEIECNQKYIETFSFVPKCRVILAANIFPRITDHSSAFYNRLIIIPFDRIFEKHEQDTELVIKLKDELPGIFNWCVEGYQRLKNRKQFKDVEFSREAVEELEDTNNPSNLFFREHVNIEAGASIEKGVLFDRYREWSEKNKQYTLSAAHFSVAVYKMFHKQTPKNAREQGGKRVWRNLVYINFKFNQEELVNVGYNE